MLKKEEWYSLCLQEYTWKAREGNLNMPEKLATAAEAVFTFDDLSLCRVLVPLLKLRETRALFKNIHVLIVMGNLLAKRTRVGRSISSKV